MRVCDGGRRQEKHVRIAGRTRGRLSIAQEADAVRRRSILVARVQPAMGCRVIPALYDVVLIASTGERWVLTGHERIQSGPLAHEYAVAQTWILEPAAVQDLIDVEFKWSQAQGKVSELERQLRGLAEPKPPA